VGAWLEGGSAGEGKGLVEIIVRTLNETPSMVVVTTPEGPGYHKMAIGRGYA